MDSNVNDSLSESVFFTARPRPLPSTTEVSTASASSSTHPASSSSSYYSARIHCLTERMINLNLSEVDAAIEASKDHWTQVEPIYGHSTATNSLSAVDASMSERARRTITMPKDISTIPHAVKTFLWHGLLRGVAVVHVVEEVLSCICEGVPCLRSGLKAPSRGHKRSLW